MIDFNYLIHGSVIFAIGLFLGLIGALISTHGARKELKKLRKRISDLESATPAVAAPVAVATAEQAVSAEKVSTEKASAISPEVNSDDNRIREKPVTDSVDKTASTVAPVETASQADSESFDHTKVKIATPKTEEHRFDPPNLHDQSTSKPVDPNSNLAPLSARSPEPVELDSDRPKIVIDEKRSRTAPAPVSVVVPPRDKEPMPIPKLTPAAASLAADSSSSNNPGPLNLRVDRDNDIHGRIEPSLDPAAMRGTDNTGEGDKPPQAPPAQTEKTIWDSHDDVATGEDPASHRELPPINEDGSVGFETPREAAGEQEPDEESKKRSLRKALLTGGRLMGVDND